MIWHVRGMIHLFEFKPSTLPHPRRCRHLLPALILKYSCDLPTETCLTCIRCASPIATWTETCLTCIRCASPSPAQTLHSPCVLAHGYAKHNLAPNYVRLDNATCTETCLTCIRCASSCPPSLEWSTRVVHFFSATITITYVKQCRC